MTMPPSGEQFEITLGDQRATIVEVGGGVREYSRAGRDVLHPYDIDAMCDGAHGTPLIPWPNRLADGRYRFDGTEYQVALTEPGKQNAIHGFLRWRPWQAIEQERSRLVVGTTLHPMMGYPFSLDVRVEYVLDDTGLTVTTTATNVGAQACPYANGQHPYLSPGTGLIDECLLRIDAETRITTDDVRQLPTGSERVAATPFDFREPRKLGGLEIDFAFDDLRRDAERRAWIRLTGTDGKTSALWVDESFPILEVYTADTLAPSRRRAGLGSEPMTCPPNGLQSGDRVIRLEPGESAVTRWGACLI